MRLWWRRARCSDDDDGDDEREDGGPLPAVAVAGAACGAEGVEGIEMGWAASKTTAHASTTPSSRAASKWFAANVS